MKIQKAAFRAAIAAPLAVLLLAAEAGGQDEPQPLSLEDAHRIAAENNPTYRKAQNALITAAAGERQSRAAFLPNLSLNLGSSGNLSRSLTGTDPYGKPVRRPDPLVYTGSSSFQGISLSMPLFDGGRNLRLLRAAQATERAVEASTHVQAFALEAEVTRSYYDARRKAELIHLEERLLEGAEARHAATERLLRIASASPVDLLGAELAIAEQVRALELARGEARKAMLLLGEQIGVGDTVSWELSSEAPPVFDPATLRADSLVARAFAISPQLGQIEAQARAAEQQRRAATASRWPSVSASAGFSRGIGSEGYGALFDPNPLNQHLNFGLSVSLPIFTRFQTSYAVAQARVAALNAGEDARATRLALSREVRSALIDLENAFRTARLAEQRTELATRRVELANQQFRLGSLNFDQLQTMIDQAAQAERDRVNARYEFAVALATLEQKVGGKIHAPAER